jgi:4-hydroxyacetophenone monooxygenase
VAFAPSFAHHERNKAMKFTDMISPFTANDATLLRHLDGADIPTLIITTAFLSRDYTLLRDAWRPEIVFGIAESGMSEALEAEVRETCFQALKSFRDGAGEPPGPPTYDEMCRIANWMMGPEIEPFIPQVYEEVVVSEFDPRAPRWTKDQLAPDRDLSVAIIGAGESGILAGLRLKQAGIPFVIFEKNDEVGGTWYENHYPGCRVDCNSFFYSYALARGLWPDYYGKAEDVLDYFKEVARQHGLYEHIRFNTVVAACRWDEAAGQWNLLLQTAAGEEEFRSEILVSAVGQLNRPSLPDIPGQDDFLGPSFHSARWDHSVDLSGKKVGVIGTGASALQFIPEVAKIAEHVTVFARTPPWLLPTPLLHEAVSESMQWLLQHLPFYSMWYRVTLAFPGAKGMLDGVVVDPDFKPTEKSVSALNDAVRQVVTDWITAQAVDRPDLLDSVIPDTPIGAKRIIRDNGTWIATLKRDNVNVVRNKINAVTPVGIVCDDGGEHQLDAIVYGTGFHASQFLMPMQVIGRDGVDLHEVWDGDDARAYLGMTVPQFPNMFILYGPNTNQVVHGGSAIMWSEFSVKYLLDALRQLLSSGATAMDVKDETYWSYSRRMDEASLLRAWGFSKVSSWYKNSKGRATQNYPFSSAELWQRTHEVDLSDYELTSGDG